ncbi:MAG: mechanosensitive ion channel [Candidatus Paracaedibacteraceae bacterium]|nr:mechanosensitive ion channel [Candidatus Paracaedibacteraceae bacterium]
MILIRLFLIFTMFLSGPLLALELDHKDKTTELTQQKDEILGTLSTLVGKKEKVIDKKGDLNVKINDLKDAIKILENSQDRVKLIKVLSAIAFLKQETEKDQGIIEIASAKITGAIEISSAAVINAIKLTNHIPDIVAEQIHQLKTDEAYRHNTFILSMILMTALGCAIMVEIVVRRILLWLNLHRRPQEYSFKTIHIHVFRNITPLILFGLVGYLVIYLSQAEWNIITYRGFIFMNILIMIRSMWLLIRVLFGGKATEINGNEPAAENMSFQFALAGIQTIIIGAIFGEVGSLLGMGDLAVDIWLKIIGFGVTSLIVIGVIKNKPYIESQFKANEESLSGFALLLAKLVEIVFRRFHIIIASLSIICFSLWMLNLDLVALSIAKSLLFMILLTAIFIMGRNWIYKTIIKTKIKLQLQPSNRSKIGLNYLEGSTTNIIQTAWHLFFILMILEAWGIDPIEFASSPTVQPILAKSISVLIILIVIRTLWGWVDHIAKSHIRGRVVGKKLVEPSQFVKTVTPILNSVAHWVLAMMAIVLILVEFGQDVRPMLYSLGVIGIAISLGAQSLVKDIINGVLTLMEGNIAVGETVIIGASTGTVESLSLRSIVLRHGDGAIQTIPFSEVTSIINRSRDYTSFPVNLLVSHKTDPSEAQTILKHAFGDISNDPLFSKMIMEPLVISGIDKITDTGLNITGYIKIKPDPGNRFGKAFNTYLQKHMDAADLYPPPSQKILNINEMEEKNKKERHLIKQKSKSP